MDIRQLKADAKSRGLELGWLPDEMQQPQVQAPLAPQGAPVMPGALQDFNPVARQMLEAAQQQQAATPVYMPFAAGTPTLDMRNFQERGRQFDESMAFDRQRWEADQAYRAAALAASQAQTAKPKLNRETAGNALQQYVDTLLSQGLTWQQAWGKVEGYLRSNSHLLPDDLPLDDALRLAANYMHYTYPPEPSPPATGKWQGSSGVPMPYSVLPFLTGGGFPNVPEQENRAAVFDQLYSPDMWTPIKENTHYWNPNPLNPGQTFSGGATAGAGSGTGWELDPKTGKYRLRPSGP